MIRLDSVSKKYGKKIILGDVSLTIDDGEYVLLTGASGAGKTTLLHMLGGLEKPDSGKIIIDGLTVGKAKEQEKLFGEKLGFLFQNYVLMEKKTVLSNLNIVSKEKRGDISVAEALEYVGLAGFENRKVYELSGGEQQRVALARVLLKKCSIILADEPTSSLDYANARIIIDILKKENAKGKTIVVSTHTPELYKDAGTFIHLDNGCLQINRVNNQ